MTFNAVHKSYAPCSSYAFKQNEVAMDKPIYVGFAILELSKLHMYETYYDNLQSYFGQENIQLHYIDTDGMILSMITQFTINGLNNLEHIFDFSNLDFSNLSKTKGISNHYSKNIKFQEYKKCLEGEKIKKIVKNFYKIL